jgi:hypothetical protein
MKITFTKSDQIIIVKLLRANGVSVSPERIKSIQNSVAAAFEQQLEDEIQYMITEEGK